MTKKLKIPSEQYVEEIISELERLYPNALCSLTYNSPHEVLIACRLSAQCTDVRVNSVTPTLFEKYPTLEAFSNANVLDIEEIIKPCGLYKTKAKSIVEMSRQILNNFGGQLPQTIEELVTLSGVGRKTANLVMGVVHHQPAIIADTHCIRISNRLNLANSKDPVQVEQSLKKIIPPKQSEDFCHRLVFFGREYCKARNPICAECRLKSFCSF